MPFVSGPASTSVMLKCGLRSCKRDATTHPARPPPMMMKSAIEMDGGHEEGGMVPGVGVCEAAALGLRERGVSVAQSA
jgi:hypothetical protein